MTDITKLLRDSAQGKKGILDQVLPLVEKELHDIASNFIRKQRKGHTLQATALVNEAYIRLVNQKAVNYRDKAHFIAIAAKKMREVLLDHEKRGRAAKRMSPGERISLCDAVVAINDRSFTIIEITEALEKLEALDSQLYDIVILRLLGNMRTSEIAEARGQSVRTVQLHLKEATMVLLAELDPVSD